MVITTNRYPLQAMTRTSWH